MEAEPGDSFARPGTSDPAKRGKHQSPHLLIAGTPKSPPNPSGRAGASCLHAPPTLLPLPSAPSRPSSSLPVAVSLLARPPLLSAELFNGLLIAAAVLWEGRNKEEGTMRLTKAAALRFVS